MNILENKVKNLEVNTRPASDRDIEMLQENLGFSLSAEYREYLKIFGVIAYGAYETYGLGVPDNYYLNVLNAYRDLSEDSSYPECAVPLMEVGDGQYYLYDSKNSQVLLWATPHGGVVRTLHENLESFLLRHIFAMKN